MIIENKKSLNDLWWKMKQIQKSQINISREIEALDELVRITNDSNLNDVKITLLSALEELEEIERSISQKYKKG